MAQDGQGEAPETRKKVDERAEERERRARDRARLRRLIQATVIVVVLVVAAVWLALRATASPSFYGLFPWLSDYTTSWEKSGHKDVACSECHFIPGVGGSARREAVSLSLLVDRLTGVHSTGAFRFPGNVSCAQDGCHAEILGESGDVTWKGVDFSHARHLKQIKRGLSLACTTCHQQVVHGTEKPVDTSSCMACHLKGLEWEEDIYRCELCHDMASAPKDRYDHSQVVKQKMNCEGCHADITPKQGGEVDPGRCVACHPSGDRAVQFSDVKRVHERHVTQLGFACTFCHHPIKHAVHPITLTDDASCSNCHRGVHEAQRGLYLGVNPVHPGAKPQPDPMAKVHVHCEGCHTAWKKAREGEVRSPTGQACNDCHGPGYDKILKQWSSILRRDLAAARKAVDGATAALRGRRIPKASTGALQDARAFLRQVERGHGEHNIVFAVTQLDQAVASVNRALEESKSELRFPRIEDAKRLTANECSRCHLQVPDTVTYRGARFQHEAHVRQVGDCESCHTPYADHGKLAWGKEACAQCHSSAVPIPHPKGFREQMGQVVKKAGFDACLECHNTAQTREQCTPCHSGGPQREIEWQGMKLSHRNHAKHDIECTVCHTELDQHGGLALKPADCNDCHGVTMPHPDDFVETHGQLFEAHRLELETCSTCHEGGMPGEFCQTCHG